MNRCFVIQPFDKGKFDKRYADVYSPAIRAAKLEPYRVDRDPAVNIPIEDIENGIRDSEVCLVDITEDNPNVWFELGWAIAAAKPTCLLCSSERTSPFPFDIQHRSVIQYDVGSPSDFTVLGTAITKRLTALLKRQGTIQTLKNVTSPEPRQGLRPHEIAALALVATCLDSEGIPEYQLKQEMEKSGFTHLATAVAVYQLKRKGYLETDTTIDHNGNSYAVFRATESAIDWLLINQEGLDLRCVPKQDKPGDDVPF